MSDHIEEEMTIESALKTCLATSYHHVEVASGAKEIVKTLNRNQKMDLVVLTKDLTEAYQKLIVGLCQTANVPVCFLEERTDLGKLYPQKLKKAGAVGIKNFVNDSAEKQFLLSKL